MTRDRARISGEEPFGWSDDEINRYLAMRYRSCIDGAFTRGEKPT
jgi:hypothetical protein